jgi:uncharacterized protein (UPF0333 family)
MEKGQVAIEFMFIILIVIVYITTVTIPLVKESKTAVEDIDSLSRANNETQKILNAVNEVYLMGEGSRQTINVYIPQNTTIYCEDKNFSFKTTLTQKPYPIQCDSGTCTKVFDLPKNVLMECNVQTLTGPAKVKTVVEKTATKVVFTQGV